MTVAASMATLAGFIYLVLARMRALRLARTAGSLAFTTLLGLVPLATVAITFAARFPLFQRWLRAFEAFLLQHMLPSSADVVIHHYREFTAKAANLTGVSVVFICITATLVTATIEREINAIWGISRGRSLVHRFFVYALGLTIGPLLIGASISLTTWLVAQSLAAVPFSGVTPDLLLKPMSFLFSTAALTLLYGFVPARPVASTHAAIGGASAALAFEIAKYGFA